eukprot:TRINITY_DN8162_c0_g2_i1.p1 TRINITY_DN8162_c0_g2~~TRINITY_DN8162_c0_g2_i1.p1  ORF type:complete len:2047 (-),score=896.61 TRINITY_DN8162_c0_g2_i1:36-6176(-)
MSDDLTILEVVEIVIEKISEAISQLLLMVIDIQKTNSPIPPKLAPAANSAKSAADTLVNTAYQLAEDEYYDFEDIKQEIIEAADEVNASGENLVQSVQILREAKDRNKHWGTLIDACKIIAEKTILLLRIVYGAEIKKIYAQKKKAQENMKLINPELLFTNPKEFAESVSKAAQAANNLAQFLMNKANETNYPMQKEALTNNAQALEKQARAMLNAANEYIKDKNNPTKKGQFAEEMKKLNELMENATKPLDQDYAELKELTDPNSLNFRSMSPEEFTEALKSASKKHRGKPQTFGKLIEAIRHGDEPLTKELLKDLTYENTQVSDLGKQEAENVDPEKAKEILNNVATIEKNNALLKKGALDAVKTPKDENKLKNLETLNAEIENAKENIYNITEPPKDRLQHLANDTIDKLKSLQSSVQNGDIPTAQRLIKDVIPNIKKLCKNAQQYAKDHPEVSIPELNKAINTINELMPKEVNLLSTALKNNDDPSKANFIDNNRYLQAGIEDVLLPLFTNPERLKLLTENIENNLDEQVDDPTNKPLEDIIDNKTKKVQAIATNVSNTLPPNSIEKKELDNALEGLKKAIPQHQNAVKQYNPKNPKSTEEIQKGNKKLGNAVKLVAASTMNPKEQTVFLGKKILADLQDLNEDPSRIDFIGDPLGQLLNTFNPKANQATNNMKDPNAKKRVKELTNQIEPLWTQVKKLSEKANDKKSLQEAAKANKKLFDVIQAIIDEIASPSNDIIQLGNEALRNLNDQLSSLPKGESGVNEKLLKDLDKILPELLENTSFSAENVDDPVRKHKLQHQIETIQREKPNYVKAVQNAIKNPNNEKAIEKVETAGSPIQNAIDQIIETIASPETQLANTANALLEQIDQVEQDIKNKEFQGIPNMAQSIAQGVQKLAGQAKVLSSKNPDPVAQEQMLELSELLENLLPNELDSINEVIRNPEKKPSFEKFKVDSQNLKEGIRDLLEVSHPTAAQILVSSVDKVKESLAKIKDAVDKGDVKGAKEETSNVQKLFDTIEKKAKHLVREDPIKEKQLENTLDKLHEVLKKLPDDVQNGASSKEKAPKQLVDNDVFELSDLADEIVDVTGAAHLAEAKRLENELKSLANSVKLDQPKPIANKIRKVADRVATLIPLLEEESKKIKSYDPEKAKNLQDIADALTELMPKTGKLTENYLKKPTEQLQTELLDAIKAMESLASEVASGRPKEHNVNPSKNRGKRGFVVGHEEIPTSQSIQAGNEIQKLLPQLVKTAQTNDPQKLNGLIDDLSNLSDKVKNSSPLRALAHVADRIADKLDKITMKSLDKKDPNPDINKLEVLLPLLFEGGNNALKLLESPIDRKIAETCLENLKSTIPRQINLAKENFKNPSKDIIPIVASLSEVDNNLGTLSQLCNPSPEEALLDGAEELTKALKSIQEAAPKGDTKRVGEEGRNIEKVTPEFVDALSTMLRRLKEPLRGEAKELAGDLINKLNSFQVSLEKFENDPKSGQALANEAKDIEQSLSKLMDKINAEPLGLAKRIEANLIKLHNASQAKNVNEIGKLAKALDTDSKALQAIARKKAEEIKDPQRKKKLLEAIPLLKENTVLPITAVKNLIKNVNDPLLNMEVVNSIPMVLSPVATIIAALDPTLENQIKEEANNSIANICKALDGLKKKKDPKEQLEELQKSRDQLSKLLNEKGDKSDDKLKKELKSLMLDYDNLLKDFPQTIKGAQSDPSQVPQAENLAEQMKQALNNIIDTAGNPPDRDEDLIDTKLDGDLILASMKSRGGGKWNAKDLLTAAQELSDCLNDMVDKNRQKQDLLENWDDLLGLIDNASGRDGKKQKKVDDLLDQIYQQEIEKKKKEEEEERKRKEQEEKKRKEEEERRRKEEEENKKKQQISNNTPPKNNTNLDPNSLGGQIGNLANDIESSVKKNQSQDFSNEPAIKRTLQIAEDLARLAEAAEKKDQQGVINAGRNVAANINELVKELTSLANQCPDPYLREQMLRDAQGLKNYAIQLKIVASVSAASLDTKGGHERLLTMATSFTKSIKGCIEQVSAASIKIKQKKK